MSDAGDLLKMQQDAIRRVRMMQEKARQSVAAGDAPSRPTAAAPAAPRRMQLRRRLPSAAPSGLLSLTSGDHERTLLLVLLLLLLQEDTDPELLLALLYLIL